MTIKVSLTVTPVDETAKVTVSKKVETAKEWSPYDLVDTVVSMVSREVDLVSGEQLQIIVEPNKVVVLDKEQNVVRLEDPNSSDIQEARAKLASSREEAEKAVVEDKKKRFQSAERLDREARERASHAPMPVDAVPNVPPLPEELDKRDEKRQEAERGNVPGPFPPRGGARDSHDVKNEASTSKSHR